MSFSIDIQIYLFVENDDKSKKLQYHAELM